MKSSVLEIFLSYLKDFDVSVPYHWPIVVLSCIPSILFWVKEDQSVARLLAIELLNDHITGSDFELLEQIAYVIFSHAIRQSTHLDHFLLVWRMHLSHQLHSFSAESLYLFKILEISIAHNEELNVAMTNVSSLAFFVGSPGIFFTLENDWPFPCLWPIWIVSYFNLVVLNAKSRVEILDVIQCHLIGKSSHFQRNSCICVKRGRRSTGLGLLRGRWVSKCIS